MFGSPFTLCLRNLKRLLTRKTHEKFSVHTEKLKTQQTPVILDLYLAKTRAGKSHDYRDVIVYEKFRFRRSL